MNKLKTWAYVFRRSATDPLYYKDILKVDFWFSFKYLLVLLFFLSFIPTSRFFLSISKLIPNIDKYTDQGIKIIRDAYPEDLVLTIMNGKLYTNVEEPYYIDSLPNVGNLMKGSTYKHFITIDTQGIIDEYPQYQTLILVTQDGVIYPSRSSTNEFTQPQVFFFSQIKQNVTLNKRAYSEIVSRIEPYVKYIKPFAIGSLIAGTVLFPFLISWFSIIGKLIQVLILGLVVWLIGLLMKTGLKYGEVYKLSLHGITAPILAVTVLDFFKIQHSFVYTALFFLFMVIVLSKIPKVKKSSK